MARRTFAELLGLQDAADRGELPMTVDEWDRLQEQTTRARARAARVHERDRFENRRTD